MKELVTLSFPGLGIGEFTVNKIIFSIGKLSVRWYALMIVLGIITAYFYACKMSKKNGITSDDITDATLYSVIAGVIGARAYFVLSRLSSYDKWYEVFYIWEGGLAIYGAVIGGAIALFIVCKVKKLNVMAVFDTAAPGVLIAQAIGRWGNFFNGEAYGIAPTEGTLGWLFRMTVQQGSGSVTVCQPCFFYESIWCVLGFILINVFYNKKKFHGQVFYEYVAWYGLGRMFIEGLRTDSLYLFNNENLPRKSQLLAFLCVLAGAALLFAFGLITRKRKKEGTYVNVFPELHKIKEKAEEPDDSVYGQLLREKEKNEAQTNEITEEKDSDKTEGDTDNGNTD